MARPAQVRGPLLPTPAVMTIDDLAVYLQLSKSSLYKLVKSEQIPGTKIGRHWRFHREVIDNWLKKKKPRG